MKLYQFSLSPNAKRVRVAAHELGVPLEIVELDGLKGEHKSPEFLAKNPNGKVPVIEDEGVTMWESPAILVYLAGKYPSKGLLPQDPLERARGAQWMLWNASHLEPGMFTWAWETMIKPMMGAETDQARADGGKKDFETYAPILNAQLEGKQFVTGSNFGIADIAIGCSVEFATVTKIDIGQWKHMGAWLGRLQARDAWKKASA